MKTYEYPNIKFLQSANEVQTYRFIEVAIEAVHPNVTNPFTDVRVICTMEHEDGSVHKIEGFCDSQDGSLFKVRLMPKKHGNYHYHVTYCQSDGVFAEHRGVFTAIDAGYKGLLTVDENYPWHFKWEGTGEHFFLNGTTCYYLLGFEDEKIIHQSIDRLHEYKINRIRVLLYGRQNDKPWGTPVVNTDDYHMKLNPWVAKFPDDVFNPEFDLTRFNGSHWQKYERLLAYAREKDMTVSVIFSIGAQCLPTPFMQGSEDECRYFRYAVSRLAAFSNVTWDLGNEHDFHRETRFWPDMTGNFIKMTDPYNHLRGAHNKIYFNTLDNWLDMQLIQVWDAGLHDVLIKQKQSQKETSRIIPQVIEEYGYEDLWEKIPGQRCADTRRRCAWEVYMAGGYQTNGESPRTGTGLNEDTGGGWINGRGDSTMIMLESYVHIVDFFTSFEWWKTEPNDDVIVNYDNWHAEGIQYYNQSSNRVQDFKAFCLVETGKTYVFYLPAGGNVVAMLEKNTYKAICLNPRTGEIINLPEANNSVWISPDMADNEDWVFLLTKYELPK